MPAPEMTVFSELAETMKKTASLPNISKNMWSEIYPPRNTLVRSFDKPSAYASVTS
ncbi:hypothetical protein CIP107567_02076 [Corynebacterium diphtheriae]|nr:hypothetical protein CIP107567_02076 [Corynebacterium diphtheriae]